jgi:RHS repeat-associated protein
LDFDPLKDLSKATRSYETDNHIINQNIPTLYSSSQSCTAASSGAAGIQPAYTWGADGRPANYSIFSIVNSTTANYSAHWDGDTLLYVAEQGGMVLYTEKLGFSINFGSGGMWPTLVYDRDFTGTAANSHFSTGATFLGFTTLNLENVRPYTPPAFCKGGPITSVECSGSSSAVQSPSAGGSSYGSLQTSVPAAPLDAKREDGYFDGTITIQGARAYDPNMNQWITPDAYAGDVHDPMSQHPYMWNKNNPVVYSDPNGYTSTVTVSGNNIDISISVQFTGDTTSPEGQAAKQSFINGLLAYGGQHGAYNVSVNVSIVTNSSSVSPNLLNTINIQDGNAPSLANNAANHWTIGTDKAYNDWGDMHEAGHVIGLPDAYKQPFSDDWKGNIMHEPYGQVDSRDFVYLQRAVGKSGTATLTAGTACMQCMYNPGSP